MRPSCGSLIVSQAGESSTWSEYCVWVRFLLGESNSWTLGDIVMRGIGVEVAPGQAFKSEGKARG